MFWRWSVVCLAWAGAASPLAAQDWAQEMFKTARHDFGVIAAGAKAEYRFVMTNIYQADVHVDDVWSSCGCTSPRIEKKSLATYEDGAIIASINSDKFRGQRGATLTVSIDKPWRATAQLSVSVYIRGDLTFEPSGANFGSIDAGRSGDAALTVTRWNDSDWRITKVRSDQPWLSAKAVETARDDRQTAYRLQVHLSGDAPPGYLNERLLLVTNDSQAAHVPVVVEGQVLAKVTVNPTALFLGVTKRGQRVSKQIVVRGKQPLKIMSVDADRKSFEWTIPPNQTAKPLQLLPVTFLAGAELGKVERTIRIQTDLQKQPVEIPAYAVVNE